MILLLITTVPAYTYTVTTQKVPMQFAPPEASGIGYVVSFAIGASIVTILLWILRFCHGWYKNDGHSMMHAYNSLPPPAFENHVGTRGFSRYAVEYREYC
jgi:hypothetical protein